MTNERFIRWQANTMAQLSTALSLLLGLSVAALGFLFSLLQDKSFTPTGCYAFLYLVALAAFFIASMLGIAAVVTRLLDFRLTANKVRGGSTEEPLAMFGTSASGYGKATWRLFWLLLAAFSVGVICASVTISRVYLGSLFRAAGF